MLGLRAHTTTSVGKPRRFLLGSEKNGDLFLKTTTPGLLACSAAAVDEMSLEHRDLFGMRQLGEDRKGFFDQFYPTSLFKGAVRVTLILSSTIHSTYMSDQLREDMRRDELVDSGQLSRMEADHQAEEWANQEWSRRWGDFPKKLAVSFGKFQALTLVMRVYEALAAKMYDEVMLDKLTIDWCSATRRRDNMGKRLSLSDSFIECWYSNFIYYLADYSVHQIILVFTYGLYIRGRLRKRANARNSDEAAEAENELRPGPLALSFTKKSVSLALARGLSLFLGSVGGAFGAHAFPGYWGTLMGFNMGDTLAISISDGIVNE